MVAVCVPSKLADRKNRNCNPAAGAGSETVRLADTAGIVIIVHDCCNSNVTAPPDAGIATGLMGTVGKRALTDNGLIGTPPPNGLISWNIRYDSMSNEPTSMNAITSFNDMDKRLGFLLDSSSQETAYIGETTPWISKFNSASNAYFTLKNKPCLLESEAECPLVACILVAH